MTTKDRKETREILKKIKYIEEEFKRVFAAYEYQIESLKEENKRLRDSLEKVESHVN